MQQLEFDLLFVSGSRTSRAAAEAIADGAPTLRRRVFGALEAAAPDGMTDEEMQVALRMSANTQRPRRVELERAGLVEDSGRTRPTRAGRLAVVWVASGRPYTSKAAP